MTRRSKATLPTEHQDQMALFDWMRLQHPDVPVYAVPNAAKRSFAAATYLRSEGLKPGVPDIVICRAVPPYHGMYLELKRARGGVISDEQHDWLNRLCKEGYACAVAHGLENAMLAVGIYLRGAWHEFHDKNRSESAGPRD